MRDWLAKIVGNRYGTPAGEREVIVINMGESVASGETFIETEATTIIEESA